VSIIKQQFLQYKSSWINSAFSGLSCDENKQNIPWFSYPAIANLQQLTADKLIFEFGCGSSTLFFLSKNQRVISLETNKIWFKTIAGEVFGKYGGTFVENAFFSEKCSLFLLENAYQNPAYYQFLHRYPLDYFDIIVVDSLHRYQCSINSLSHLKKDGILIVDDFERRNYQKIADHLQNLQYRRYDFIGIAPASLKIKNTAMFRAEVNNCLNAICYL